MDGDASGRIKCTLANWTGVAYKISFVKTYKLEGLFSRYGLNICLENMS